ncbi:MAG: thioredoxin domain-containing protein [Deltaproteobacteria bacterium]|nr:thioredoxin domain-containing protein [Deltaproteobacteria bacterium]
MTRRGLWRRAVLVAAILAAACNPRPSETAKPGAPAPSAKPEEVARRIEEYFTKSVTPGITLKVAGIVSSEVPGWNKGTLDVDTNGAKQSIPFLVSPDGRYFISGEVTDLTVDPLQATLAKIDLEGRPFRGPADAKVTIVEFSDFQCPFCARGYQILEEQVMPEYEGKVRLFFKHLPLKSIHPWAEGAALAAECAADQGAEGFWKMYHALFKAQRDLNLDNLKAEITGFAKSAGLDGAVFAECYDRKKTLARIEKDLAEAAAVGANSTPTFFINGRRLEGAQPLENFKAIIDEELG